jgi:hypothetical protein
VRNRMGDVRVSPVPGIVSQIIRIGFEKTAREKTARTCDSSPLSLVQTQWLHSWSGLDQETEVDTFSNEPNLGRRQERVLGC